MEQSKSRVIHLVESFYQIVYLSFLFWGILLKGGVVYAWIQGIEAVQGILTKKEFSDLVFRKLWRTKYDTIPFERTLSFLLSFSFISGWSSWFLLVSKEAAGLVFLFFLSFVIWMLVLVISTVYVYRQEVRGQERLYFSLLWLGKHPALWCSLFLILGGGLWLALTKNWLVWLLFPGCYFFVFDRYYAGCKGEDCD